MYELSCVILALLTLFLLELGFSNVYYPDAILMFVIIPFLHLMNDEDTKTVVLEKNWVYGLIHTLGIRNQVEPKIPNVHPQQRR